MARCRVSYTDVEEQDAAISNPPKQETESTVIVLRKPVEHMIRLKPVQQGAF